MQDLITIYVMNSWPDVGGCDMWCHSDDMPPEHYVVYHGQYPKEDLWNPQQTWTYKGWFDWVTYGAPMAKAKAKSKAKSKANAASRKRRLPVES